MKIFEVTNEGISEKTLTDTEIDTLASEGNREAKSYILKKKWGTLTEKEKIEALADVVL